MNYYIEVHGGKHSDLFVIYNINNLDSKLLIDIYNINNNYYILESLIQDLSKDDYKWNWLKNNLFDKGYDTILKNDIKNKTIKYKKLSNIKLTINNKNEKLFELNSFIDKFELQYLVKLYKSNNFEEDLIKICGTKNKIQQDYYRFIFKNIQFNFIEYKSDIDKIKEEYDKKIKDLSDKLNLLMNN